MDLISTAAIALFIILHRVDGGEIIVNSAQITSLRSTPGSLKGQVTGPANCLVGLTDGKFAAVVESCAQVKHLLEESGRK